MEFLTPQKIAEITGGMFVGDDGARNLSVKGAVRDNRDVRPGNLFVCIRGARVDGHSFANSAFLAGAACCLAEQEIPEAEGPYVLVNSTLNAVKTLGRHYRSLFDIPVVGITGSVGKTTTKEMTAAVLGAKLNVLKTPENLNNELGVPLTLLSLDESHEAAVIEMGISEFGEMSRLSDMVRPDICIITKIGHSHLESLGDLNGVLRAKSEVFANMGADSVAVMNGDDDLLFGYDSGTRKVTFGLDERNDFRAVNIHTVGTDRVMFDIVSDTGSITINVPSFGAHLAAAALAAAAVGRLLGLTDEEIVLGLSEYAPVGGRSSVTHTGYITLIDDCYNANPDSVKSALLSLSSLTGRRVAILGDMLDLGPQSMLFHREVGRFAASSGIDCLICCGDMAAFIHEGYTKNGGSVAHYYPTKPELVGDLQHRIRKGDAVLVKASHSMKFEELLPCLSSLPDI